MKTNLIAQLISAEFNAQFAGLGMAIVCAAKNIDTKNQVCDFFGVPTANRTKLHKKALSRAGNLVTRQIKPMIDAGIVFEDYRECEANTLKQFAVIGEKALSGMTFGEFIEKHRTIAKPVETVPENTASDEKNQPDTPPNAKALSERKVTAAAKGASDTQATPTGAKVADTAADTADDTAADTVKTTVEAVQFDAANYALELAIQHGFEANDAATIVDIVEATLAAQAIALEAGDQPRH